MKKILLAAFCLLSVVQAQVPDWFTTQNHTKYKKDYYLLGIGSGSGTSGLDAAKKAAMTDLVSQIRVHVQSEMKSVVESYSVNSDEQVYSDIKNRSKSFVNEEIAGIEIAETAVDAKTGTSYALAILNKDNYAESVSSEINVGWQEAANLRAQAKDFYAKGRLNEAVQSLLQIRSVVAPLFSKQVLHNAVARIPYSSKSIFHPGAIISDMRDMFTGIRMTKLTGDNQTGKIGKTFQSPFVVRVTLKNGQEEVPCAGVTVDFIYDLKNTLGKGTTDAQGNAAIIPSIKPRSKYGIQAVVTIDGIDRDLQKNLRSSAVTFQWNPEPSDKVFQVRLQAPSKSINESFRGILGKAVTASGYTLTAASDLILDVQLQKGTIGKVEGMAGVMVSAEIDGTIVYTNQKSNETKGVMKFSARGVGKNENEALAKAARSIKLDDIELSSLLEK